MLHHANRGASVAASLFIMISVCTPFVHSEEKSPVVGRIGDHTISVEELRNRIMMELKPADLGGRDTDGKPVRAKEVLKTMLAETAMSMEGRTLGLLRQDRVYSMIRQRANRAIVNKLLQHHLKENLKITQQELQEKRQANPDADPEKIVRQIQVQKSKELLDTYYEQIMDKFHAKKVEEHMAEAGQIYRRLLLNPKQDRKVAFVRRTQIDTDLTAEERELVLATYEGGDITLQDLLTRICETAPPSRPGNLHTAQGIEQYVDQIMKMPLLVAEAKSLGLDQDPEIQKNIRQMEDSRLLGEMRRVKSSQVPQPDANEIREYFDKNKGEFRRRQIKINEIWTEERAEAEKAKELLEEGKDFEQVKQEYTLNKEFGPRTVSLSSEGVLWERLWSSDPDTVVGPIRGFFQDALKWRLVKILEKDPGEVPEFDESTASKVKWHILRERTNEALKRFQNELLEKYSYEIYEDRLEGVKVPDMS